jgi:multidrug resistance protein
MAAPEREKTISPLVDPVGHSTPDPNAGKEDLGTTSRTLSKHTLESVAPSSSPSTVIADNEDVEHGNSALSRVITPQRDAVKVPRSQRRGLLGRFSLVAEVQNPYDYSNKLKWFVTFIVAFAAAAAPMGSSIFFRKSLLAHRPSRFLINAPHAASLGEVAVDLNTSPTITNLSVALYMLSMAIFPLWWSAFSEAFGRRSIYLISFILFVIFGILSAISNSIAMLVVTRMLSGGAVASVQAVGVGTIADVWEPKERGRAMGIFYLGPLCGPLFAPIIGGALAQRWNWRATLWFLVIYGGEFGHITL